MSTPEPAFSPAGRRLSFVVPCYNERLRLEATLDVLGRWYPEPDVEFVVVDDGSEDGTAEVAERCAKENERVSVVRGGVNRGKGGAIRAALHSVRGEILVVVDADLPYDRASVDRACRAVETDQPYDVAIGNRRHRDSSYVVPTGLLAAIASRHFLGGAFNLLVRAFLPIDVRDTQSGLKSFRRAAFISLFGAVRIERFAFDVDLLMVARQRGLSVGAFPVHVRLDRRRGTVRLARDGPRMIADLLRVVAWRWSGHYRGSRKD